MTRAIDRWRALPARQEGGARDGGLGKQQRTRRRLLGFAMQLFAEQGYQPTTVAEIAAAAGVSRATFFLHFPTKAALLGELSREVAELWEQEPAPDGERGAAAVERFLTFLFRETDLDAIGTAVLIDFVETYGADMGAGIGTGTLHDHVTRLIARAQDEGDWTRDWSAASLGHYVLTSYNLLRPELAKQAPADAAAALMRLVSNGVRARL